MTKTFALIVSLARIILSSCIKVEPEEPVDSSGYNCISGNCYSVSENAQYSTLSACQSNCTTGGGGGGGSTAGYNCISGNCVSVSSGAQYSTFAACQSSCSSPKGQLMVWTNMTAYGFPCNFNLIYVSIIGVSDLDPIYGGYYTSEPACGATYCVTRTLDPGTYTVRGHHYGFGSCPAYYTNYKTVTVYANQCTKVVLP
jgi:hypothetical protein